MGNNPLYSVIFSWVLYLCVTYSSSQRAEKLTANPCVSKNTCHECIQTPTCGWCFDPDPKYGDRSRCFQPLNPLLSGHCKKEFTWNPSNQLDILLERKLSEAHSAGGGGGAAGSGYSWQSSGSSFSSSSSSGGGFGQSEIVQVSPQRLNLKLRAKQSYSISMHYTQAEDYPVDLYYLMDLSKSMEDDKDKLSKLGNLLADSMRNITSNFNLGFGSFVDKVVMPYVSTVPKKSRTYDEISRQQMVKAASVSGNLDAPEGGFDAIMQAVVCRNEIGWREKARRLLVFSTDAGFHYAGDGKLGGIVKPNDGLCHLDSGLYTHSSLQDYPSISQINLKVKQNAINVIFAVTEEQIGVYQKLQAHIEGASSGKLSNDSSNVVDLVKEQYEQISSTVEMKDNASSSLKISYYSKCLNFSGPEIKTNKCGGIKVGDVVTFRIEIELSSCPLLQKDWNQMLQIYPVGINESLLIDLEMLCNCPCEQHGYIENADICKGAGTYKCGICECNPSFVGRFCECSLTQSNVTNLTLGCRLDNTSTVDCSGRGTCVCDRCECDIRSNEGEKIYGDHCECDNFSCARHEGKVCSGPAHGTCECGECVCKPPWGGPLCDCRISNETCYAPGVDNGEICSGHGDCVCGSCKCHITEEGKYSGKHCEKCPTCADRCDEFKICVQCQVYQTGPLSQEECLKNCTKFTPISVTQVEATDENENLCAYYDEKDCRFAYVYYFDDHNKLVVKAQEKRECPHQVFFLGIVLGVIAAIVLMGLAILLLWKLLTTIHDRREFAKFEKERMMAKWDTGENPIYKQATSTFKNPTYAGKG